LHAKVGHCQAIHTKTPLHANGGVFLFVLPQHVRTLKTSHAICTIGLYIHSQPLHALLCDSTQHLALTHKKAHILVGWGLN
jgi:hypothetical protein